MEVVGGKQPFDKLRTQRSPVSEDRQYRLRLVDGELRMGSREFRARHLLEWQRARWEASAPSPKKKTETGERGKVVSPIKATTYVLGQLGENEWVRPGQLSMPLRIFCDAHLSGEEVCAAGWQWGCLARQEADGNTYYRLPRKATEADVDPTDYLYVSPGRPFVVNLEAVPYQSLEHLARISNLQVTESGRPYLSATPDLIRIGNALEAVRDQPLTQWLRQNAPAFRQALETVEQRWGKQIIHENLLLARVSDAVLKVKLEKSFSDPKEVVFLPNDFIAFPHQLLPAIEKVVSKSGHVIRTVQRNG